MMAKEMEELVDHNALMLRIARTAGHPEPEEVAQQVALTYLKAKNGRCNIRDTAKWLSCVTWRIAINSIKERRNAPLALVEDLQDRVTLENSILAEERRILLNEAIASSLSLRQQEVVKAIVFDGRTFAQVGALLGCSPNTCKTLFYRAKQDLSDNPRLRSLCQP